MQDTSKRCSHYHPSSSILPLFAYPLHPSHIGPQGLRDDHAAVLLLVVFQDRKEGSANGQSRSVQGMNIFGLFTALGPKPDIPSTGLKGLKIATGGNLFVGVLTGQPYLDVVCLGRRKPRVARAEDHH